MIKSTHVAASAIGASANTSASALHRTTRLSAKLEELLSDHSGPLPVWIRAPKKGVEYFSGASRAKLYEWAGKNLIRSVSIREPGQVKGVRLFHLGSLLNFIARCEASATGHPALEKQ